MINLAEKYLGIGYNGKIELMEYYNDKCYPFIASNRKYKIKPNDNWCAMFTTVIAHMAGLSAVEFPYEVSVWYQCEIAKKRGLYFTDVNMAKPNDLIIYDWGKTNRYNHVGFVVSVGNGMVRAIEGNKSNTVAYRSLRADNKMIRGFISTNYNPVDECPVVDVDLRVALLAVAVLKGKLGDGSERRAKLGSDYQAVQDLINM
jgi:hypothetical protein